MKKIKQNKTKQKQKQTKEKSEEIWQLYQAIWVVLEIWHKVEVFDHPGPANDEIG